MNTLFRSAALLALFVSGLVQAQVTVSDAWVRETFPGQKATGAFMTLQSPTPARLVGVESPVAGVAEVHEMSMQGNTMQMRAVAGVDLPAGQAVAFKPGGYHVMLMDLKSGPLKNGDSVPLKLKIKGADGKVTVTEVKASIRGITAAAKPEDHSGHNHKH